MPFDSTRDYEALRAALMQARPFRWREPGTVAACGITSAHMLFLHAL